MEGWIKIHNSLLKWEWFDCSEMVHIFVYLLLSANFKDNSWHGMDIKRGQLVTSRSAIKVATGISEQTIRTCLKRLVDTKEIELKSTNKHTMVTICNYDKYQLKENQANQQLTNNQPATNQPTTEEYKNIILSSSSKAHAYTREEDELVGVDEVFRYLADQGDAWKESVSMAFFRLTTIRLDNLNEYFEMFAEHLKANGEEIKQQSDIKKHFMNWLRIQAASLNKFKSNENNNRPTKEQRDADFRKEILNDISRIGGI